jgi:ankyrin repeat protein
MRKGNLPVVSALIDENPELTNLRDGRAITPLHLAARLGNLELANLLLDRGAQMEAESSDIGSTPLKYAVFFAETEMVKLLLKRGADIDNRGGTSRTPLDLALAATTPTFREMGTPGSDLDYARIANILRSKSVRRAPGDSKS